MLFANRAEVQVSLGSWFRALNLDGRLTKSSRSSQPSNPRRPRTRSQVPSGEQLLYCSCRRNVIVSTEGQVVRDGRVPQPIFSSDVTDDGRDA